MKTTKTLEELRKLREFLRQKIPQLKAKIRETLDLEELTPNLTIYRPAILFLSFCPKDQEGANPDDLFYSNAQLHELHAVDQKLPGAIEDLAVSLDLKVFPGYTIPRTFTSIPRNGIYTFKSNYRIK